MHTDPARLREQALRRAHALREQAIDEALRRLGRWLRRRPTAPAASVAQELPCRS